MSHDASVSSANFDSDLEESRVDEPQPPSPAPPMFGPTTTRVYYFYDKDETPYCTDIQIQPQHLTLGLFKTTLPRTNFKYYNYTPDEHGKDVKLEVRNEATVLQPSSNGIYYVYLLTDESAPSLVSEPVNTKVIPPKRKHQYPLPAITARHSNANRFSRHNFQPISRRRAGSFRHIQYYDDSTIMDDTNFYPDTDIRYAYSDEESSTFTSVSQQRERNIRRRYGKTKSSRRRRHSPPSFLNTTNSASDASIAVDLITVTFDLRHDIPLGLIVVAQSSARGDGDDAIVVSGVSPNSLASADGRIRPSMIIIEVNGISLSSYHVEQAIDILRQEVRKKGLLQLTCAKTEKERYVLPDDTVMPINTSAWVQQTTAIHRQQLNGITEAMHSPSRMNMVYNPGCLNAGGRPSSGVGTSIASDSAFSSAPAGNTTTIYQAQPKRYHQQDTMLIAQAMASPTGGLDCKPKQGHAKTFEANDMFDWLRKYVNGLESEKKCQKFSDKLVHEGLIVLLQNKKTTFTREVRYAFTDKVIVALSKRPLGVLNTHPAMDDTLPAKAPASKGIGYRLRKLFCVHAPRQPTAFNPSDTENAAPLQYPVSRAPGGQRLVPSVQGGDSAMLPGVRQNYYMQYQSTHIP